MESIISYARAAWAQQDAKTLAAAGAVFGVGSHLLYWMHGLRTPHAARIFFSHVAAFSLVTALCILSHGPIAGLLSSTVLCWSYLAGVFTSTAIYRVWFHRLSRFPGPFGARVSRLYTTWVSQKLDIHNDVEAWHDKYGDIVRTGPMDISVRLLDAVEKVQGVNSPCTKEGMGFWEVFNHRGGYSLEGMPNTEEHRLRRQIWDKSQNPRAMAKYEMDARAVIRSWLGRVQSLNGSPVDITRATLLVAFDNSGRVGFSKDFGAVSSGEAPYMDAVTALFETIARVVVPWPVLVVKVFGEPGKVKKSSAQAYSVVDERLERDGPGMEDIAKYFLQDFRSEKPKSFRKAPDLYAESRGVIVAATETAASTMAWIFYYLTVHPHIRRKLLAELEPAFGKTFSGEFTDNDLAHVEYLDAVVKEALRVKPSSGLTGPRLTPPEGLTIDGVWIPGHTQVTVSPWLVCRSAAAFVAPREFIPERWTARPELVIDDRGFNPFSHGRWSCAGKKIAMMLMRFMVAYTTMHYDWDFAPGEDGEAIIRDTVNLTVVLPGRLHLVFKERS